MNTLNPKQLFSFLSTAAIPNQLPVLITGAPGIGKTDTVRQACAAAGAELITTHPVVSDPTDYKGMPAITTGEDGSQEAKFLPFNDLAALIRADQPTVFFLDDLGQAPPIVQAAVMQLLLARRVNGHVVSEHVTFIAATNRRQDRAGVQGLLEPVKSRFATIVELAVDLDSWCQWAIEHDLPIELVSFARFRPGLLHDFQPTNDLTNSPSPRTLHNVAKLMQAGVPNALEYTLFAGAAGEGFAAEFLGFLKIFRSLPNPDAVLMNPNNHELPTDPATCYALCGALARRASEMNFDAVCTIADRMRTENAATGGAEFGVVLISDATQINKTLTATNAFTKWASKNANMLL